MQIVDMGLPQESAVVLGAALHWQDGQDSLLVLTQTQLRTYIINLI